ncbi:MAG: hypothetical protein B0D92_02945 [Spirochaeta sp. LUC14_002_19_P3]|nr:MAG: hypothetical protein B0D92_02945 [Spirochaeta sp. LUC14_002_19_P3]
MIKIQNLSKRYGSTLAVDDLSVDIPQGEILGLLGPNGAGKSTTLRIMTGYLPPTSGTILVDEHDVTEASLAVKKLMGYLPESAPLYTDMLVYDYLSCIADVRGISSQNKISRLKELARLCSIGEVMHKPISNLSKGYRQRVGLALALMDDPPILILDEPTSGLDPNQIAEIRSIIREIGKQKTIIFSTHILSEAEATCDRVVIINKGKIAADGSADSLKSTLSDSTLRLRLKNAQSAEVQSVLEAVNGVHQCGISAEGNELAVEVKSASDMRESIYGAIKSRDWTLMEMVQEKQSLEKIFRELTTEAAK